MDSEQRKKLRNCLTDQGFERTSYTNDYGDGAYVETWSNGTDTVVLSWATRRKA
jgi:hypothetical protein